MSFASLIVCTSSECHVRREETTCPHCGSDLVATRGSRPRSRAAILLGLAAFAATDLTACAVYGVACTDDCQSEEGDCPDGGCPRPCTRTSDCLQTDDVAEICANKGDGAKVCTPAVACNAVCASGMVCVAYATPAPFEGCSSQRFCFFENDAPASCELDGGL